jgi:RHS repeat-associated protein
MKPNSNQLQSDLRAGHTWVFTYSADGSRLHEGSSTLFYDDRSYRYDGLERMSGFMKWDPQAQPQPIHVSNPTSCRYDPEGQLVQPCDNGAPKLAYEGHNVVAAGNIGLNWSFVHGPALDDPLMGLARWNTGNKRVFFWVTDGQGRHLVFADSTGRLMSGDYELLYGRNGGKYAGGTSSASSFQADRFSTPTIPGLSFFRNRAYDRNTGRWTQEDPIGVAGGLNLYQFNGNNPVMYTDPFGLKECKERGNCIQGEGGEGEARLFEMRHSDVIVPTDASPLLVIGGIQRKAGAAGTKVVSVSEEFVSRAIERGVKPAAIMDALRNPLKVGETVVDALGRPSQQFVGRGVTVVRNPETGNLITLWRTSTHRVQKLLKELGQE